MLSAEIDGDELNNNRDAKIDILFTAEYPSPANGPLADARSKRMPAHVNQADAANLRFEPTFLPHIDAGLSRTCGFRGFFTSPKRGRHRGKEPRHLPPSDGDNEGEHDFGSFDRAGPCLKPSFDDLADPLVTTPVLTLTLLAEY